jgi:2-polyprenyl-3-methyl-5-hydroxy-6-metoxy-1,4-benzoquinol methylase
MMPTDLFTRNQQPELMDDPTLNDSAHRAALAGLRRINWWSRTDAVVWNAIRSLAKQATPDSPLTILDIASGGGDLAIRLSRKAQQENVSIRIHGCDISPTAIEFATEQASKAGLTNISFFPCNALTDPLPIPQYDVIMCSLFLHHLKEREAVLLLERMKSAALQMVLVDDLRRSRLGYWLAWLGCRILTRCHVVHVDGPMSVEGAFTTSEARDLAVAAGLPDPKIVHHWPERFLLTWRPREGGLHE